MGRHSFVSTVLGNYGEFQNGTPLDKGAHMHMKEEGSFVFLWCVVTSARTSILI